MDLRVVLRTKMVGAHHDPERPLEGSRRVGEECGDAGECLLFLGVEDVEDHADEE